MFQTITDRKIRIALIGCGRISKNHIKAICDFPDDLELVALCDNDKDRLASATKELGVKGYENLDQMLLNERLDLVSVCTPSGMHPTQTKMIASAGVNIVSEKPMATNWTEGMEMVEHCEKLKVKLFIVKQNRLNPTLQLLKRAINDLRFGRIFMVNVNVFWTRPQTYYDQAPWRGTWELDGGAFMNQASHYVDLLDWLIGPVEKIQAMTGTLARNIEVEDTGVYNIKWRNGALGSMNVTMLTYPKNLEGSITILGERGTVQVGGIAVNEIKHWEFEDKQDYDHTVSEANYSTNSVYGFGHNIYFQNVIDVFKGLSEPDTDGREGLKSLEVLVAGYLAARDGTTVSLPLEY